MKMLDKISIVLLIVNLIGLFFSCEYHDLQPKQPENFLNESDSTLFVEVGKGDYEYYKKGVYLSPDNASPHGIFRLRLNKIALSSLDATGKLPEGKPFPEGAVIVKEVYRNERLVLLAVMKKSSFDSSAGNGWLWAEYAPDQTVLYSLKRRGIGCINCHSEPGNRDLVRYFELHP